MVVAPSKAKNGRYFRYRPRVAINRQRRPSAAGGLSSNSGSTVGRSAVLPMARGPSGREPPFASALGVGFLPGVALYPPLTPCSMGFRLVFRCGIVAALRSLVAILCVRVWLCGVCALVWVLTF